MEAGVVRYGVDVDASTLLLEAPLAEAYSLTKGCYVGQEVVARITYRGHVNRKIVGFRFADARVPPPGAPVLVEGEGGGADHERRPLAGPRRRAGARVPAAGAPGARARGSRCRTEATLLSAEVAALPFYRRTPSA